MENKGTKTEKMANEIIGIAIKVHRALGPGFVEKIYSKALAYELKKNKIQHVREEDIRIKYENVYLGG